MKQSPDLLMEQLPGVDNEQWSPEILDIVIDRNPNDVGMSFDQILTLPNPNRCIMMHTCCK